MQSKTSFFNKTIFKRNISQFGVISIVLAAIYFFSLTFNVILKITKNPVDLARDYNTTAEAAKVLAIEDIIQSVCGPWLIFFVAIIVAAGLFGYLFNARQSNMIHSFPVKLSALYTTNVISGLLIILVPILVNAVIVAVIACSMSMELVGHVMTAFLYMAGYTLFFYGLACFTVMFTGQMLFGFVFYFILNGLYMGITLIVVSLIKLYGYGLDNIEYDMNNPLFFIYYLSRNSSMTQVRELINGERIGELKYYFVGGQVVAAYAIAGIVLIVLGFVVYKKRKVETASDFITIGWAKVLFRWGFAACMGTLISLVLSEIYSGYTATQKQAAFFVVMFILILVFFFVGQMLIKKGFRVNDKKTIIEGLVCATVFTGALMVADYAGYGIENKIPKADDVKCVVFSGYNNANLDGESIEEVIELHRMFVENRKEIESTYFGEEYQWLNLTYMMKDGTKIRRYYSYRMDPDQNCIGNEIYKKYAEILNSKEAIENVLYLDQMESITVEDATLYRYFKSMDYVNGEAIKPELRKELLEAIKADTEAGHIVQVAPYDYFKNGSPSMASIEMRYDSVVPVEYYYTNGYSDTVTSLYVEVYISPECENIANLLIREGMIVDSSELQPYYSYEE